MSQNLTLENRGLYTNSNLLSRVPKGALTLARNCSIDRDGVLEGRRGFERDLYPLADDAARFDRLTSYQDHKLGRRSNDDKLCYFVDGVGWSDYSGTYQHPDADYARMRFMQAAGNVYFTTNDGVKVLDNYAGPVYNSGMPRGLDGTGSTTGASGFMTDQTQVAYRIVWGSRDANNNLYLGTPSQRIIVANVAGGPRDVSLTFTIPSGITENDFFQVYRSPESGSATDEPSDELQLVYEKNPSAGQIAAKSVTFTDSCPTSLMGASLYTNASQEGIAESNDEPPLAKDICVFKNYTFFVNVKTKHKLNIKMLAAGAPTGVQVDDTITIAGMVFTAKGAENIASMQFKVTTSGSASQNIADTAQSLVRVINQYASNTTIYAYYISGYQDLPGQILLMARSLGGTQFTVTTSRATAFDLGTAESLNDEYQNGVMWSKDKQNEHVPSAHLEFIGSKNAEIHRVIALRDSVFFLKDDGVFRATGSGGNWTFTPLDTSTRIVAPDSAVVMNNQIFAYTDQGIVSISDVGVEIISIPIEDQIRAIRSISETNVKTMSFGLNYDTDRKFYFYTISSEADSAATQAFVYNTITKSWTTTHKPAKYAFVNPTDDRIYIASPTSKYILKERKSFTYRDFVDEEIDGYSIVSASGKVLTLNTIEGLTIGDQIYQSSTVFSNIVSIDAANTTVTVYDTKSWTPGVASVFQGIDCHVEYVPSHFDNPGVMKHFQEIAFLFRESSFAQAIASFFTDLSGGYSVTTMFGNLGSTLWGLFPWGSGAYGGAVRPKPIRVLIPREKSRGSLLSVQFRIRWAQARWSLNGVSAQFEFVSERTTRS